MLYHALSPTKPSLKISLAVKVKDFTSTRVPPMSAAHFVPIASHRPAGAQPMIL